MVHDLFECMVSDRLIEAILIRQVEKEAILDTSLSNRPSIGLTKPGVSGHLSTKPINKSEVLFHLSCEFEVAFVQVIVLFCTLLTII